MPYKKYLLAHSALCTPFMILGLHVAMADDPDSLPAVSGLSGKLELWGGGSNRGLSLVQPFPLSPISNDFEGAFFAKGAVTIPLSHRFGLQLDGVAGSVQSEMYWQGATHLFWRNPTFGLFGVYGAFSSWDGVSASHIGVESEAYFGRLTLQGITGYQYGDIDSGLFSFSTASYYVTDDFSVSLGHRYEKEVGHALTAGLENLFYQTPNVGVSVFVDGRIGEGNYRSLFAGMKLYFGEEKSLIRRHREDDPEIWEFVNSALGCTDRSLTFTDGALNAPTRASRPSPSLLDSIASSEVACNAEFPSVD